MKRIFFIFFIPILLYQQSLKILYEPLEGVPLYNAKIAPLIKETQILETKQSPVNFYQKSFHHPDKLGPKDFKELNGRPVMNFPLEIFDSKASYDTLSYWNKASTNFFYWNQPDNYGDINYSVRFTPIHNGTLKYAIFWFYNLVGSGNIRIHVWNDNGGFPGTELGYVDFPTSSIAPWPNGTVINLSSLGINVTTGNDFYVGYSLLSGVSKLGLVYDTFGLAPERCYDYWPTLGMWETSDWIHDNMTWLIEAVVEVSSAGQPNLTYYTPSGWAGPIVPSSVSGTHTVGPNLQGGATTYIDWAIVNNGTATASGTFYTYLYSDNVPIAGWYTSNLQPNYYAYVEDWTYTFTAGNHTLKIFADSTNVIAESNENDNKYSQSFYWAGASNLPNLTYYTPTGWDGPIVPSSVSGTHTVGPNLQGGATTYIDWAIVNNGTDTALATFYIYLYSDGSPIAGWYTDSLPPNYYTYVQDWTYTFSSGNHTLGIFADSTNTISESNETDNKYSQVFSWGGGGGGEISGVKYVIITSPNFVSYFEPLAWWKTKKGVPTKIVTTNYIYANYPGTDNKQKIRNFISAQADSGVLYILLGGQMDWEHSEEIVPRRDVWCMQSGGGSYNDEDTIPTDMYYSNLDGNWNGDGDNVYGEMNDNVDLYSDIAIGRAPVKNTSQVTNFVNKVLTYEKNPPTSYIKKILLPSVKLFDYSYHGVNYYGYVVNNAISNITPAGWQDSKLEDNNNSQTWNLRQAIKDSLNNGFHFCHFAAHGDEYGHYYLLGSTVYNYSDAQTMNNGTKYSIINAISCFTGAVDEAGSSASYDCIAEHFVNRVSNGAVATIMNTRYGLAYPPSMGPSEVLDTTFYRLIFIEGFYHLGEAHMEARDRWASSAQTDQGFRWCVYELTLFGDPEMPIWTDTPQNMNVSINLDSLIVGQNNNLVVTVQTAKAPVQNALVCLATKNYDVYDTLLTNSSGQANFTVNPSAEETIFITVTKHNYLPYETYRLSKISTGIPDENEKLNFNLSLIIGKGISVNYDIPEKGNVKISVLDVIGRKREIYRGTLEKGKHNLIYKPEKSGVYFILLEYKEKSFLKKIVYF